MEERKVGARPRRKKDKEGARTYGEAATNEEDEPMGGKNDIKRHRSQVRVVRMEMDLEKERQAGRRELAGRRTNRGGRQGGELGVAGWAVQ